jgi:signal transduction histidine kinase
LYVPSRVRLVFNVDPLRVVYLVLFGTAAVACFVGAWRSLDVSDAETRTGLFSLLVISGTWALASVGRLLPVPPTVQTTLYMIGLVVGLATVGPWLYFCSAYTGHDFHRRPTVRTVAVTLFLVVVSVKLTNPLHGLYFETTPTTTPFSHLVIELKALHWVVTGLAYALSAVGFYLLFELFDRSRFDTTKLSVLVAVTATPALLDIVAYTGLLPSVLLKFNFEPIGVAIFAIGTLYVADDTFVAVPRFWKQNLLGHLDDAIVVLDRNDCVRDYNDTAGDQFPALATAIGGPIEAALPELATAVDPEDDLLEYDQDGDSAFYRVRSVAVSGATDVERGRILICTDVTELETQRRALERQTDQFDDFSEAITHELRNAVTLIDGYLTMVANRVDDTTTRSDEVPIDQVGEAVDRMQHVISDLTTLARYSQPVDALGSCDVRAAVASAEATGPSTVSFGLATESVVRADSQRLEALFDGVLAFAAGNDATHVTVDVESDAVVVTTNGSWLSERAVEKAFAYGEPVPSPDAGMTLPNVRMIARSLGWETSVDRSYTDGVRLRIDGVTVTRRDTPER